MEPAYFEGDRGLTFNWGRYKRADVIVFRVFTSLRVPPFSLKRAGRGNLFMRLLHSVRNDKKAYMIKRIEKIRGDQVFVSGDNKKLSSVIRPIYIDQIVGKVILKY